KRGWIMLPCIVGMCIAGSFAAWSAGHVVLGGFSLFLTFFIGIRFLIKPDTQRDKTMGKGAALGWKGVLISLFFGLTIGFGTGFVGSGGGMMMLVVFTAFLGMERKSAVGTSTFIMTFTALIASVSHIMIDPTIALERWDVLLICIVTATGASIISAQFANRVNNRMVGLATGAILTVLGAFMLILNYRDFLSGCTMLWAVLSCLGKYLIYLACCVSLFLILKAAVRMSQEVWRKCLHFVAYTSILCIIFVSENWLTACICCVLFTVVVYPLICLAERRRGFDRFIVQRKKGEIKRSLWLLFLTHAVLIALCWGWLGRPYICVAAILMWGAGDTMAALIGKKFGQHHIQLPWADYHKTWEGAVAMALTAFAAGVPTLALLSDLTMHQVILSVMVSAAAASIAEACSHNGNDTVSVPVTIALVLSLLTAF
ncbi:MAG: TSUP family transporter, partial [Roseburia sp.]|nr:TSUP family transporter [Roseburia sp.]